MSILQRLAKLGIDASRVDLSNMQWIVTNAGVGDVERIMAETGGGVVVRTFDDAAYHNALTALDLLRPDEKRWRTATRNWLGLDVGIDRYDALYRTSARSLR